MKHLYRIKLVLATLFCLSFSSGDFDVQAQAMSDSVESEPDNHTNMNINITIDGETHSITLADTNAAQELYERLQQAPVTLTLNDNGGFEIWGPLGFTLTASNQTITAQSGDVMLYNGSNICFFYGTNSWSYTRLGKIEGLSQSELSSFLKGGQSNISVTLSVSSAGLNPTPTSTESRVENQAYRLNGQQARAGDKGVIIQNGKKFLRR